MTAVASRHPPEFLSVSQFAAREGVSRIRVLQLLAQDRIAGARKLGHHWAIPFPSKILRRKAGRPRRADQAGVTATLRRLARKYIWWLPAREAAKQRERAVSLIMEMGDFDDVRKLEALLGRDELARVIRRAAPGSFTGPSWSYWHYRLGLSRPGRVPPLPKRAFQ